MKPILTSTTWIELKHQIELTANECKDIALVLTRRAFKLKKRKKIIRGLNVGLGGIAFIVGVIIPGALHENIVKGFTALASIALFIDGLLPNLFDEDPPERFTDYAYYIRNYSNKFSNALLEETSDEIRKVKILILLDLANNNINNVKTLWHWVDDDLRKIHIANDNIREAAKD